MEEKPKSDAQSGAKSVLEDKKAFTGDASPNFRRRLN